MQVQRGKAKKIEKKVRHRYKEEQTARSRYWGGLISPFAGGRQTLPCNRRAVPARRVSRVPRFRPPVNPPPALPRDIFCFLHCRLPFRCEMAAPAAPVRVSPACPLQRASPSPVCHGGRERIKNPLRRCRRPVKHLLPACGHSGGKKVETGQRSLRAACFPLHCRAGTRP